jgi:hypothetical protein
MKFIFYPFLMVVGFEKFAAGCGVYTQDEKTGVYVVC